MITWIDVAMTLVFFIGISLFTLTLFWANNKFDNDK